MADLLRAVESAAAADADAAALWASLQEQRRTSLGTYVQALARKHPAAFPTIVTTSSDTGLGIPQLRAELAALAEE